MELRLALGMAGNVTSVLLYLSPIFTFKRVIKKGSTEEFSCIPYVVTLSATSLFLWYGLPVVSYGWENITLATICCVGTLLELSFILIYIWFASSKRKRILAILLLLLVIMVDSVVILVSSFAFHDHHHRKLFVGSIGLVLATGMYSSPLVAVKRVIQTKSVEFMPFYLSLFAFLNTSLWGPYGLLGHDLFIALPNLFGWPLSIIQLTLYCVYRKHEIHNEPIDTDLEKDVTMETIPETDV